MRDTILEWLGFLFLAAVSVGIYLWLDSIDFESWWKAALVYLLVVGLAWWRCDIDHIKEYWWRD